MSRPFSYNDENFTVIGNLLFCHIWIDTPKPGREPIVEIPPAIYNRMLYFSTQLTATKKLEEYESHFQPLVAIKTLEDGKHYLFSFNPMETVDFYLVGYFMLQDI